MGRGGREPPGDVSPKDRFAVLRAVGLVGLSAGFAGDAGGLRRARGDRGSGKWAIVVVGVGSPVSLLAVSDTGRSALRVAPSILRAGAVVARIADALESSVVRLHLNCQHCGPERFESALGASTNYVQASLAARMPPAARKRVHSNRFERPSTALKRVAVARKRPRRRRGLWAVLRNAAALQIDGCAC